MAKKKKKSFLRFLRGYGSVLSLTPLPPRFFTTTIIQIPPSVTVAAKLRSDWQAVGTDFYKAIWLGGHQLSSEALEQAIREESKRPLSEQPA